jgi:methyl-accepting chemotaxis protein
MAAKGSAARAQASTITAREAAIRAAHAGSRQQAATITTTAGEAQERVARTVAAAQRRTSGALTVTGVVLVLAVVLVAMTVSVVVKLIIRPLRATAERLTDIGAGEGDLRQRIDVRSTDEIGAIGHGFNRFVDKLAGIIRSLSQNADAVGSAAGSLDATATSLATHAATTAGEVTRLSTSGEQVSKMVVQVAAASEQLASSIREIASNTSQATQVVANAVTESRSAATSITELGASSARIGDIVGVIQGLAEQTNLLALNATIEAARAGDAGRGFAVVASEVKKLSLQVRSASADIQQLATGIRDRTEAVVQTVSRIGQVVGAIDGLQSSIAAAVEEQSVTVTQISNDAAHAATETAGMIGAIANVGQSAEAARIASGDARSAVEELGRLAGDLRGVVGEFRM